MNLLPNSPIHMEYRPATDILVVEYPNLEPISFPMVKDSLVTMVEAIMAYDIKKLLLDASRTIIDISEQDNQELSLNLAQKLAKTRLLKVARIKPVDQAKELQAQKNIDQMETMKMLSYSLMTFDSKDEALHWLKG